MSRFLATLGAVALVASVVLLLPVPATGQTLSPAVKTWTPPKTPDGQPDLQGIWSNATITPLERPRELAGKQFFTEKEAAEYEKEMRIRNNMDRRDVPADTDVARAYNDFWWDRGTRVVSTRRTSLIVDPPEGTIPPVAAAAQKRADDRAETRRLHPSDGPESRSLAERCLLWVTAGPPMLPSAYNNNYQIVQTPGSVTILNEMVHDVRTIPLDGRAHLPQNVRQWMGDSRGHWEGDTLVVDTTNFTGKSNFRGSTEKLHVVERFTRTDPDTILYEFTVDDPATWTRPWTAQITSTRNPGPVYEYACHEGNYGMFGILTGARAEEKRAVQAAESKINREKE